jgi:predicted nucleic acid-binding protein
MPRNKTFGLPVAVIDNTLLSRLAQLDIAEFLPLIFDKILIPIEVRQEAFKASNKRRLRNLLNEMQGFFVLCNQDDFLVKELLKIDLDEGEAAAIAQAEYTKSALILDEKKGRNQATKRELEVFPTLKILCLLKEVEVISEVKPYLDKLIKMKFHLSLKLYNSTLKEVRELE